MIGRGGPCRLRTGIGHRSWPQMRTWKILAAVQTCLSFGPSVQAASAEDEGQTVTIVGGADDSGHRYQWTVTNYAAAAIVFVEIPHARGDLFLAPPGWTTEHVNQDGEAIARAIGYWKATAQSDVDGIAYGQSAVFSLRVSPVGADRGVGTVTVRHADNRESAIAGVEVPVRPSTSETFTSLIALGAIFGVFLAVAGWRARRRRAPAQGAGRPPTATTP